MNSSKHPISYLQICEARRSRDPSIVRHFFRSLCMPLPQRRWTCFSSPTENSNQKFIAKSRFATQIPFQLQCKSAHFSKCVVSKPIHPSKFFRPSKHLSFPSESQFPSEILPLGPQKKLPSKDLPFRGFSTGNLVILDAFSLLAHHLITESTHPTKTSAAHGGSS